MPVFTRAPFTRMSFHLPSSSLPLLPFMLLSLQPFKDLVSSFVSILKQITEHRLPRDFDYHRTPVGGGVICLSCWVSADVARRNLTSTRVSCHHLCPRARRPPGSR